MSTSSRIANGPRPSNIPRAFTPLSALWMNRRNSSAFRYPPFVPNSVKPSSLAMPSSFAASPEGRAPRSAPAGAGTAAAAADGF